MELNEYQKRAMTTCTESSRNFSYMALNLVGEVGEFMSKVAKAIRKEDGTIDDNELFVIGSKHELKQEAGDIMWQISGLCTIMGWSLEEVCQSNLDKLASRKERDVIVGDGDNR